jgi:hypothetical protein
MKNIHILPTNKSSRLHNYTFDGLGLSKKVLNWKEARHIYITSDEEIKEGDWIFDIVTKKIEIAKFNHNDLKRDWKKIILTTDQDLIKDGVQAIDDEFLEWFVRNLGCEEVKIEINLPFEIPSKDEYEIIIPKKELLEEFIKKSYLSRLEDCLNVDFEDGVKLGAKWQQERSYSEEEILPLLEILQKCKEYFLLKTDKYSDERADAIIDVLEKFKNK